MNLQAPAGLLNLTYDQVNIRFALHQVKNTKRRFKLTWDTMSSQWSLLD